MPKKDTNQHPCREMSTSTPLADASLDPVDSPTAPSPLPIPIGAIRKELDGRKIGGETDEAGKAGHSRNDNPRNTAERQTEKEKETKDESGHQPTNITTTNATTDDDDGDSNDNFWECCICQRGGNPLASSRCRNPAGTCAAHARCSQCPLFTTASYRALEEAVAREAAEAMSAPRPSVIARPLLSNKRPRALFVTHAGAATLPRDQQTGHEDSERGVTAAKRRRVGDAGPSFGAEGSGCSFGARAFGTSC